MPSDLQKRSWDARPLTYACAAVSVAIACWAELSVARLTSSPPSTTLFALSVAASAWYGGAWPGVLALILSGLAIDYAVIEPGSFLHFASRGQAARFAIFLVGWFGFCLLAGWTNRRLRQDRDLRRAAESTARHSDRLAQLTTALGQARTPAAVVEASLQEALHALAADAGVMALVSSDGRSANVARAIGRATGTASISLVDRSPIRDAVGRGAPLIVESAASSRYRTAMGTTPFEAVAAVPLPIGSRVAAVAQIEFSSPRSFSPDDRDYLSTLGTRAAQALDRTWQYEAAQHARAEAEALRARADEELAEHRQTEVELRASEARYRTLAARTRRLHGLTSALSEAVTMKAVARAVVDQGKVAVGATSGEVTRLVEDGAAFETLHSDATDAGEADGTRVAADRGLCATAVVETMQPVFIGSFTEWQERYPQSASIAADGGYVSSATLPLLADGAAMGVLAFYFTAPVKFDEEYQALLVSVAQYCAQAIDRARLYESAQRAQADAERANRLKDEFVSLVTHDLRAPLNAMLGWTSMLRKGVIAPPDADRALEAIHDNAVRQAKLIDDLLDFSRMIGGHLILQQQTVDLQRLLGDVVESMVPAAEAKRIEMTVSAPAEASVEGDPKRLEQVFFNLIGNAVKFTRDGGRIEIELRAPEDDEVEVRVIDDGVGIEPTFLPHVFERFRQADTTTPGARGGVGLGLSIARQLVQAHEGTISVASEGKNRGALFTVRLPASRTVIDDAPDETIAAPFEVRPGGRTPLPGRMLQ
ncbi:MAG: ATP-binding protein [Acidobacteriota bacterium]